MIQYECKNITQVARKVAELTNTKIQKKYWKYLCAILKKSSNVSDNVDYEDGNGKDVNVFFGYDESKKMWYVGIEDD